MTMAGGGLRDPGRITPPAKPVVPATAVPLVVGGAEGLAVGIALLDQYYLQHKEALTASGAIIYNFAADRLVTIKNILGLSADDLGELAIQNTFKDVAQVDDRIAAIKNAPYDTRSENAKPPGNCGPEEFRKLDGDVSLYCKQSVQRTCEPRVPPYDLPKEELLRRLQLNQQCVESREKLFQRCFYGGNAGHREKAINEWKAVRKCIEKLNPTP